MAWRYYRLLIDAVQGRLQQIDGMLVARSPRKLFNHARFASAAVEDCTSAPCSILNEERMPMSLMKLKGIHRSNVQGSKLWISLAATFPHILC